MLGMHLIRDTSNPNEFGLFPNGTLPSSIQMISQQLATGINSSLVLAAIDNLMYSLDLANLELLKGETQQALLFCESNHQLQRGCLNLLNALTLMIVHLRSDNPLKCFEASSRLFDRDVASALEWRYQSYSTQTLVEHLSNAYSKSVVVYTYEDGAAKVLYSSAVPADIPAGPDKILLLWLGPALQHIMYQYTLEQLTNIGRTILKAQTSIRHLTNQISIQRNYLNSTLQQHEQTKRYLQRALQQKQAAETYYRCASAQVDKLKAERETRQQQCREYQHSQRELWSKLAALTQENKSLKRQLDELGRYHRSEIRYQPGKQQSQEQLAQKNSQLQHDMMTLKNAANAQTVIDLEIDSLTEKPQRKEVVEQIAPIVVRPPPAKPSRPIRIKNNQSLLRHISTDTKNAFTRHCEVCEQQTKEYYRLFECDHEACSSCLISHIECEIKRNQGFIRCIRNCGAAESILSMEIFLQSMKKTELLGQLSQLRIENGRIEANSNEKGAQCPRCKQFFFVEKSTKFLSHCGTITCLNCGQNHQPTQRCQFTRLATTISALERPTVCPQCLSVFDKDDKCEHVNCKHCDKDDLSSDGICALCSVLRSPIKAHDNSYHRKDCNHYRKSKEPAQYMPLKCTECKKLGKLCERPKETFEQFIGRNFTVEIYSLIQQKRTRKQSIKKKRKAPHDNPSSS